jgi:hypothetical protein
MNDRTNQKSTLILILFVCSIGTLIITATILMPVIRNVNRVRLKVLSLFLSIPNYNVETLAMKCLNYIDNFD